VTHVLLEASCLVRRCVGVEVIGEVLRLSASGVGARGCAARLGRSWETVRGWLRAGRRNAVVAVAVVTGVLVEVDRLAPAPTSAGNVLGDLVEVVGLLGRAVAGRFGLVVSPWAVVSVVTGGLLLGEGLRVG